MNAIKNITLGILHGLWDSIRGMTLVLHIDNEVNRQNAERETLRQLRLMERDRHKIQRTPSPTPSSASAMAREEYAQRTRENPDERRLDSIYNKHDESKAPPGEKKIAKKLIKCCVLNGGFTWMSIIFFDMGLLPSLKFLLSLFVGVATLAKIWGFVESILSFIFGILWVMPIFVLSKIVSSLWFADIANAAYRVRKGRPIPISSISKSFADITFTVVVQILFLLQSWLVNMFPVKYVGESLSFVHLSMLYSLYSFEYKWYNMGWELHRRLSYIENNWPYFFGFGIPLTVLTNLTDSVIVSGCIFSIFFPLFILSGNEAKPIVDTTDLPLRLFSPVVYISNIFFGGRLWNSNNQLSGEQREQLELKNQQRLLKEQNHRQKLQIQQLQQERDRSNSRSRSNTPQGSSNQQFRYPQPPQFTPLKAKSTSGYSFRPTPLFDRSLRPPLTPVPGPPKSSPPSPPHAGDTSPDDGFVKLWSNRTAHSHT